MVATVLGVRGDLVMSRVVVDRVTDTALVPTPFPNMAEMTALAWDQMLKARVVTASAAPQV